MWDPLIWVLWMKEQALRFHGYRRKYLKLGPSRFGYYYRSGQNSSIPIVMIHGMALFPEWWSPLLKQISREYPICVPELVGFSRSPGRAFPPAAFTLALYRQELNALLEHYAWDRMIIAGVSLGGWIAMDYALAYPQKVAGLILYAPAGADQDVNEEDLRNLRRVFDYRTPEEFLDLINEYVLRHPKKIPRWVCAQAVRRAERNGHKHLLNNLKFEDWIGSRAPKIPAPTALIWGREDKVFSLTVGETLVQQMPKARLFPLEKVGHSYLFENPQTSCNAFFDALTYVAQWERGQEP